MSTSRAVGDVISGGLLVAFGAVGLLGGIDSQVQVVAGFGADARIYPKIIAGLLVILGALIAAGGLRRREEQPVVQDQLYGLLRVAAVAISGAGFAWLAPRVGFVPAAVLATGAFAIIAGVRRPIAILVVSASTAAAIRILAVEVLGLTLPGLGAF